MLPSILARQLRQGLADYIETTFPMTNPTFRGLLNRMAETPGAVFHEPYAAVRLPFRTAEDAEIPFESVRLPFPPYVHQQKAFARLVGEQGRSTLIAAGTGSGKTECFLYPILEHCYRHRAERGIKAILIYPMNALASDQAGRIARLIHSSPELRGRVTAGLYVGGRGGASREMGETSVITHRETLRAAPPDILMTNYKMLDYLLVRPEDAPIWAENRPDTLRYLVVDELHTFDGAQGTDLACLLRRLKARLGTPKGHLCCIGASATMGGSGSEVRDFAEQVFGEPFEPDSVIAEDRLSPAEFFAGRAVDDTLPTQEQTEALIRLAGEDSELEYLQAAAAAWLREPSAGLDTPEGRLALGHKLMGHRFLRDMLAYMDGNYVQISFLCRELASRYPRLGGLTDPAAAVNGLLALVSHARSGTPDRLRPFLTVQVQLWLRELRRLMAKVDEKPSYALSADLNDRQRKGYLPVVNCRDCGETGWASLKNERGGVELSDPDAFYNLYFRCDSKVILMFPHSAGDGIPKGMAPGKLCPDCLRLNVGENRSGPCRTCGGTRSIPVLFPAAPEIAETQDSRQLVCPFCGSRRGLALVGVRSATEISAGISHLFASRFNDDKKALAFCDNVQDAAHHAGFFNARTWRFGLRGAIQRYAQDGGSGKSLADFQQGFVDYWRARWSPEEFVGRLIAPDMVWMRAYENMTETGVLGDGRLERKLLRDIEERSKYEILLEYGLSSRLGRTLEKSGCSTLAFPAGEVEQAAAQVRERVVNELGVLSQEDQTCFSRMVLGFLDLMRRNGAFDDRALELYAASGKSFDLSNNQKTRRDWMPGVQSGRNTPRFLYVPARPGRKGAAFDRITARKYVQWISRCIGQPLIGEGVPEEIAQILFEELRRAGFVVPMPEGTDFAVWALNRRRMFVTTDVRQFVCGCCGARTSAAGGNSGLWEGAPCPSPKCPGRLRAVPNASPDYYGRLYRAGDLVRVSAREHTGLLGRADREALEQAFRRNRQKPWDPNVLSCTPTLEMGIDVGDLSTVVMCGIPPARSRFLQRAGRAGRRDGNSLTVAVASAKPHDLYFYAQPLDMIAGQVEPPAIFLQASAVLERQFAACCMDSWICRGVPEAAVPATVQTCLDGLDQHLEDQFPFNFLDFVQKNLSGLTQGFLEMFSSELDEETAAGLRAFAQSGSLGRKICEAFSGLKDQRDQLLADLRRLEEMIQELEGKPKDSSYDQEIRELNTERTALADALRELDRKNTFNFLTDEGLLPNYAFPEAGITLRAVLRRREEENGEAQRTVYEYNRGASSALREFAPMNRFYAGGRKLTIDQVDLTTARPERWRLCPSCAHAQRETAGPAEPRCPRCGSPAWGDAGQLKTMLKVRMVCSNDDWRESLIGGDSDERTALFYNQRTYVDVDEAHDVEKACRIETGEFPFGYEFVKKALLREINFGERDMIGERLVVAGAEEVRRGFSICRYCGKLQPALGQARHTFTCRAGNTPAQGAESSAEQVYLYRELSTEVLRILIPATTMDLSTVRQESFTAAFLLGMKKRFGNVDHLRAVVSEVPVAGTVYRKQYLVIYDCVPGGTGYLKQLARSPNAVTDILAQALRVLERCPCQNDPQKDGCYHCLYAYRQSSHMGDISRKTAIRLLRAIVQGRDQVEEIPSLSSIPVNSLFESELERRFIQALPQIQTEAGPLRLREAENDRFQLAAGDSLWEIEQQVLLDESQGVSVPTRADFVFWPAGGTRGRKPVAVFTDGFLCHRDQAAEDTRKRAAILRSGRFRVWVLSWKDVQSVFRSQGDYAVPTLLPQNMPAGPQMYQPTVAAGRGEALRTDRLSPMELLVKYLELDRGEELFRLHARAYAFSLLEPRKRADIQAMAAWKRAVEPIAQALYGQRDLFASSDLFFGGWIPKEKGLTIYAGVPAGEMKEKKTAAAVSVFALLRDGRTERTDNYEAEWNGFWQFFNVMQFLGTFGAVTSVGLARGLYNGILPLPDGGK